jgi:two-component system response regulator
MPGEQVRAALDILLVEDSDDDAAMVRRVFSKVGIPCGLHTARDGQEALDYLFRRGEDRDAPAPDLVLLDLRLPTVGGLDVLRRMRTDQGLSAIPVVVLTGSKDDEDLRECMALGAEGYLVKPFKVGNVRDILIEVQCCWASLGRVRAH